MWRGVADLEQEIAMFGLGTKKPRSLDRFPTDNWTLATGETDGAPVVVRVNLGAKKYLAHPELPVRLGVTIALNTPNQHGFCDDDEGEQLNRIEDRLSARLEGDHVGFLVLVVTCGGRRELIFYVRDESQASAIVDAIRGEGVTHTLTYGLEEDADWSYYAQFA